MSPVPIKLAGSSIGLYESPFVIAEMSGNHNRSLDRALALVDAAADAGADAIKLQTFTADSMTLKSEAPEFRASPSSVWAGQTLHSLYEASSTPIEWHEKIMERAAERGIACFSSPFDEAAIDFLEKLNVPAYKIASFECIDLPLIKHAASTGKPLIISTGMATLSEMAEAVDTARDAGCTDLILLKCTSTYPASPQNSNIRSIPHMRELFNCEVGLSDHTMGIGTSVAAVALGARVIEKHLTLDRSDGGVDSTFSLEPLEFASLVSETNRAWLSLGQISYGPTQAEQASRLRRRSIYAIRDIAEGEALTTQNVRRIRPGDGLPPKHYESIIGKSARSAISKGTPISWDLLA
jgi:N-acetylneuraminate synthase